MIDFNQPIKRINTNSVKWDTLKETYGHSDLLPLWIADMDFKAAPFILTAFEQLIHHGIFGYTQAPESLYKEVISWQSRHHQLSLTKDEILFNSSVVPSITLAIQAFTKKNDAIMIHDPVYPPFAQVVLDNQRKLIQSPLLIKDNQFKMDLTLMEKQMREHLIQLFILCNPHNPGGRVWSKEELQDFGELCEKYHIIVVSDEIHQDLVFSPYQFTTFTNAQSTFKEFSITLTAATKTFNLAGIKNSMVFIQNPKLKKIFQIQQEKNKQEEINTFGYIGTEAAYKYGDEWLTELLAYLKENIKLVETFFANKFPQVKVMVPEGTYLVWLDFSSLNLTDEQLQECLIQKGKVVLNPGISFGPTGTQHMRLNTACSKEVLIEGLERIKHAFQ